MPRCQLACGGGLMRFVPDPPIVETQTRGESDEFDDETEAWPEV